MKPRLQIIRGLPGAGKTTLAAKTYPDLFRLEMDMMFTKAGKYKYSASDFEETSERYIRLFSTAIMSGIDIVLTGVFPGISPNKLLPLVVGMALAEGYDIYIKTLSTSYKNTHGVPPEVLESMKAAFFSDDELKSGWSRLKTEVHFGLMSPTEKTEIE